MAILLTPLRSTQPSFARSSSTRHSGFLVTSNWKQVNQNAFGLGTGGDKSYTNEEGFEVLVFKDQLYLGMEADNSLGARLWRSKAGIRVPNRQEDWEEVATDARGYPFGDTDLRQNDHIDSLQEFHGYLYASTANSTGYPRGTRLYRSPNGAPGTWQDALQKIGAGFGDIHNENFKDMGVFKDQLCGGTGNAYNGAQIWCSTDGLTWTQKNISGFGDVQNYLISSSGVFSGAFYVGVTNTVGGSLWRTDDLITWSQVYSTSDRPRVDIMGVLHGYLYIATGAVDGRRSDDPTIRIFRSANGDPGSWQETATEIGARPNNTRAIVDGCAVFNGALYLAVMNNVSGVELWRTYGETWLNLTEGNGGFGDAANFAAQLVPFNGYLYAWTSNYTSGQQVLRSNYPAAKYLITMIGDGFGAQQMAAVASYTGSPAPYQSWDSVWMSTYPAGGSYDPHLAWSEFDYVKNGVTDSAAAATAMFSGVKTARKYINVSADQTQRLFTIGEKAHLIGRAVGASTTVYLSHATPGAWLAHNDDRENGFAITDEALWGDPNTTGTPVTDPAYGGGRGPTFSPVDVAISAGHPTWSPQVDGNVYINQTQIQKLRAENGKPGAFRFVERLDGHPDGAARLLQAAQQERVTRLAGIFGGAGGRMEYRLADGSGANPENPTLAEMTRSALAVLDRWPAGFALLVEGGSIDAAAHANLMDQMIGEGIDFNDAVQVVVDWVDDPTNDATWENTLVIVTADHETGYLTAGPGVFPDQPLGSVTDTTLKLEKPLAVPSTAADSGRRASWLDVNQNDLIDSGETVYWAWNSDSHTNSLVPLFARGVGAGWFQTFADQNDPTRGAYLDNISLFNSMDLATFNPPFKYSLKIPLLSAQGLSR